MSHGCCVTQLKMSKVDLSILIPSMLMPPSDRHLPHYPNASSRHHFEQIHAASYGSGVRLRMPDRRNRGTLAIIISLLQGYSLSEMS